MEIQGKITLDQFQEIVKTNQPIIYRPGVNMTSNPDHCSFSSDLVTELDYNPEKSALGTIFEGKVNNKDATMKMVDNDKDDDWIEGDIDGKKIFVHRTDKTFNGKYGNTNFDLSVDYNTPSKLTKFFYQSVLGRSFRPDYFNIKGTINGQEFVLNMPNGKVPHNEDEKDLVSLILFINGLRAQSSQGEIKSLKYSKNSINHIKHKSEKRDKRFNEDIKPIIMQGISTASGIVIGALVTTLMGKFKP